MSDLLGHLYLLLSLLLLFCCLSIGAVLRTKQLDEVLIKLFADIQEALSELGLDSLVAKLNESDLNDLVDLWELREDAH